MCLENCPGSCDWASKSFFLDRLICKHLDDKVFVFILLTGKYYFMGDSNCVLT